MPPLPCAASDGNGDRLPRSTEQANRLAEGACREPCISFGLGTRSKNGRKKIAECRSYRREEKDKGSSFAPRVSFIPTGNNQNERPSKGDTDLPLHMRTFRTEISAGDDCTGQKRFASSGKEPEITPHARVAKSGRWANIRISRIPKKTLL